MLVRSVVLDLLTQASLVAYHCGLACAAGRGQVRRRGSDPDALCRRTDEARALIRTIGQVSVFPREDSSGQEAGND